MFTDARRRYEALRRHPAAGEVSTTAFALIVVRGLGLASQAAVLAAFGAGLQLDAFYLALIVPNFVSVPFTAGAELGMVPSVARVADGGPEVFNAFRRWVLVRAAWLAVGAGVVVTAAAPLGTWLAALGSDGPVREEALDLAYILYPTTALLVGSGIVSAILIGAGRLSIPVVVQGVRPIILIVAVLVPDDPSVTGLAVGVLIGSLVEATVVLVACMLLRVEGRPDASVDLAAERAATVAGLRAFVPGAAGYQVTPIVDQVVVAGLGQGALVKYLLAVRFFDVSKQVLIQPVVRVAQNRLSRAAPGAPFRRTLLAVMRRATQAALLSALLLSVLAPLAILVLFTNGEFTFADGLVSVWVLLILAGSLVPFALNITMSRALGVAGRAGHGARLMGSYTLMNLVLDVVLAHWFGLYGVAVATVVSLTAGTALYCRALGVDVRELARQGLRGQDAAG